MICHCLIDNCEIQCDTKLTYENARPYQVHFTFTPEIKKYIEEKIDDGDFNCPSSISSLLLIKNFKFSGNDYSKSEELVSTSYIGKWKTPVDATIAAFTLKSELEISFLKNFSSRMKMESSPLYDSYPCVYSEIHFPIVEEKGISLNLNNIKQKISNIVKDTDYKFGISHVFNILNEKESWFITMRINKPIGNDTVTRFIYNFINNEIYIKKPTFEKCIFDSNQELDSEWII